MLDKYGFDLWANDYDKSVGICDEENLYPFAGYKEVFGRIFQIVQKKQNAAVLDIGFGTGTLTTKLYEHGCVIFGQDFSPKMIDLARRKMADAKLYQGDFTQGLAAPLRRQNYDFIVSTYAPHHLTDEQRIVFLHTLQNCLKENGQILIGDIAFETREKLDQCRQTAGDEWDDEEVYFVADELKSAFPNLFLRKFHTARDY